MSFTSFETRVWGVKCSVSHFHQTTLARPGKEQKNYENVILYREASLVKQQTSDHRLIMF